MGSVVRLLHDLVSAPPLLPQNPPPLHPLAPSSNYTTICSVHPSSTPPSHTLIATFLPPTTHTSHTPPPHHASQHNSHLLPLPTRSPRSCRLFTYLWRHFDRAAALSTAGSMTLAAECMCIACCCRREGRKLLPISPAAHICLLSSPTCVLNQLLLRLNFRASLRPAAIAAAAAMPTICILFGMCIS